MNVYYIIPNALQNVILSFQEIYKELSRGHMAKRDWAIWDYAWYLAENIIFLKLDSLIPSVISLVFKTILSLSSPPPP